MYDNEVQAESESRDDYEAALAQGALDWPPTDPVELAQLVAWSDEQEGRMAFEAGWDPFTSNETPSEFLARQQTTVEV